MHKYLKKAAVRKEEKEKCINIDAISWNELWLADFCMRNELSMAAGQEITDWLKHVGAFFLFLTRTLFVYVIYFCFYLNIFTILHILAYSLYVARKYLLNMHIIMHIATHPPYSVHI